MAGMTWEDLKDFIFLTLNVVGAEEQHAIQAAAILAIQDIGAEANWEFKRSTTPKEVVIATNTDSKQIEDVQDIKNITRVYIIGGTLLFIRPDAFRDRFEGQTILGSPTYYTVRNDMLYVDATVSEDTTVYIDYFEMLGSDFNTLTNNYAHVLLAGVDYYSHLGKDGNEGRLIRFRETKKQMRKNLPLVQDKTEDSVHYDSRVKNANSYIEEIR